MKKLTAADLVNEIARLDTSHVYEYVSGKARLRIKEIEKPEGPISFVNIEADGSESSPRNVTKGQLANVALICSNKPNFPLHVDRIFSAGGNTRSALETLLAYTPNFFMCKPERVDAYTGEIKRDLKHIMWCPSEQHKLGTVVWKVYQEIITEVELGVDFENIGITSADLGTTFDSIETKRTHVQMQIALIEIGRALNFYTWIAKNDRSIQVGNKKLGDLENVISSLDEVNIFFDKEIKDAASLIDCIWFTSDGKRIPAIIEIEHSTGVTSGLIRMLKFREVSPAISTTYTIVAPNKLRNKVVSEANDGVFRELKAHYMPYSTVQELYGLIQRYNLSGAVDYRFIAPFMEKVVED